MFERLAVLLCVSMLVIGSAGSVLAQDISDELELDIPRRGSDGLGFDKEVAGTYQVEVQTTVNGNPLPGPPAIGLQTLNIGGTHVSMDQGSFTGPMDNLIFPQGLGVWSQAGKRTVAIRSELFGYQAYEAMLGPLNPPFPLMPADGLLVNPGQLFAICQINVLVEFDKKFDTAEGTFVTVCFCQDPDEICGPIQDPLDPDAIPFFPPPFIDEIGGTITYTPIGD